MLRALVVGTGVLALTTACAAPGTDGVTRAADDWLAAARAKDATTLCRLLTPAAAESAVTGDQTCPQAVGDLRLPGAGPVGQVEVWSDRAQVKAVGDLRLPGAGPVGQVEVWSDRAQVKAGADTLFLTKIDGDWRVSAAGCTARPGRPYDCEVSG